MKANIVVGSISSILFWSREKRFKIRPVGLDTKKVIGEWITAHKQRSCRLDAAPRVKRNHEKER